MPWLGLQLAFELVEEAPIRAIGENPLWVSLDEAELMEPQRVKPHAVLGAIVPPAAVGVLVQGLQRILVAIRKPALDERPRRLLGSARTNRRP